jgi:biopolymer transport protein ExbB
METVISLVGNAIYAAQALVAAWGAYCLVLVWMRIGQRSFATAESQEEFLSQVEEKVQTGREEQLVAELAGDPRAISRLTLLGLKHRDYTPARLKQTMTDRFEQDFLSDLDHRLTWVNTAIKTEPMLGLHGTVLGMIGAFGKLATAENVKPEGLAQDISLALITTAVGLTIAIPLIVAMSGMNIRISKMEDMVGTGIQRLLEVLPKENAPRPREPRGGFLP